MSNLLAGELETIKRFIEDGDIVFDVGGFVGEWTAAVLETNPKGSVHVFEPTPSCFLNVVKRFNGKNVITNQLCVSDKSGLSYFWDYADNRHLSSLHKRNEKRMTALGVTPPQRRMILKVTLDEYCEFKGVPYIDFLKIDTEGHEFNVLKGASGLLLKNNIRYVQFEYGGCFRDAGITLREVFSFLEERDFLIGRVTTEEISFCDFVPSMENYDYCNFLGVCQR